MIHEVLGCPGPMTHRQYLAWMEYLLSEAQRLNGGSSSTGTAKTNFDSLPKVVSRKDPPKKQMAALIEMFGGRSVVKGAERFKEDSQ